MLTFENTGIAFQGKNNRELKRAYRLFKLVGSPRLVRAGKRLLNQALKLRFPIGWLVKPFIFRQFCGGESIEECKQTVRSLEKQGVKTYLAYSVEAKGSAEDFREILAETLRSIEHAANDPAIPFTVFKPTAIVPVQVLEKINDSQTLNEDEEKEKELYEQRFDTLCKAAYEAKAPILVDAEESYYQGAIDNLTFSMMERYNREQPIVYNTFQMYRHDRLTFLKAAFERALKRNYFLGIKLVRGAYMEKERERAAKMDSPSPIQPDKESTDRDYNKALEFCIEHLDRAAIVCAGHNEFSALHLAELMNSNGIEKNDPRIYFGQLYGMSDHISFNLAQAGYNVVKYVPYGPIKEVLPYLIRRAEENTSVAGQTGRELKLIIKEKQRRKKDK
jgi:proline dehydrogenase